MYTATSVVSRQSTDQVVAIRQYARHAETPEAMNTRPRGDARATGEVHEQEIPARE